jgi:hypothetical protein
MNSATILGRAGIGGTLAAAYLGLRGAVGSARVTSRGQADVEEQKARRQAYYACSTSLLARRDAAAALLDAFREDVFNLDKTEALLRKLDDQRDGVARAVGAVVVEGPLEVALSAEFAATAVEELAGRLRDWFASVASGEDRDALVQSQIRYARNDQQEIAQEVDTFAQECRRVLHPAEIKSRKRAWWARRRLRLRSGH